MSDLRLARTRGRTHTARGPSTTNVELAWPPSPEDLDAIEVVEFDGRGRVAPPDEAVLPATVIRHENLELRRPPAPSPVAPAPAAPPPRARAAAAPGSVALGPVALGPVALGPSSGPAGVGDWPLSDLPAVPTTARAPRRGRAMVVAALLAAASIAVAVSAWPERWPLTVSPIDVVSQQAPLPLPTAAAPAIADQPSPTAAESPANEPPPPPVVIDEPPAPDVPTPGAAAAVVAAPPSAQPGPPPRPPTSAPTSPPLSQVYAARAPLPGGERGEPAADSTARPVEPAAPETAAPSAGVGSPVATAAPAAEPPRAAETVVTAPPRDTTTVVPDSASPPVRASLPPARTARTDEMDIQTALQRYERAYGQLDARAAQAVWPSVDVRALTRAFQGLESQALEFDRCQLAVQGAVASADCQGRATYVRRVGSKAPRTEARAWSFRLRKIDDDWQILRVEIR